MTTGMKLKPETEEIIEKVIPRYPDKRSAVMPLLHRIQEDQGGIGHQCPGDFQASAFAATEGVGLLLGHVADLEFFHESCEALAPLSGTQG